MKENLEHHIEEEEGDVQAGSSGLRQGHAARSSADAGSQTVRARRLTRRIREETLPTIEVVGHVRERHLLIAALVTESLNAVRRDVPVSSTVRLPKSFPGTRHGNRPKVSFPAERLGVRTTMGLLTVSEGDEP